MNIVYIQQVAEQRLPASITWIAPDFSVPCQKLPPMRASDWRSMKVRENKEVFGHNFVCQYARASLGERQARVQELPGP
jgi:hypothetical protein